MGVSGLWALLKDAEGVCTPLSAQAGELGQVWAEVEGRSVSVDLSELVCHAVQMPALREAGYNERGMVCKLTLERCSNALRFSLTPVGVTEGRPPPEKLERLALRGGGAPYRHVTVAAGHTSAQHARPRARVVLSCASLLRTRSAERRPETREAGADAQLPQVERFFLFPDTPGFQRGRHARAGSGVRQGSRRGRGAGGPALRSGCRPRSAVLRR